MMSLDKSYFNSIRLDTYRHKFYSVEAVDRLLVDIRSQADTLNRDLESSNRKLAEAQQTAESLTEENKDLLSKGQALSQEIVSLREDLKAAEAVVVEKEAIRAEIIGEANAEADELLSAARAEAEQCLSEAKAEADRLLSDARSEAEQCVTSAKAEAEQCLSEAKAEADGILSNSRAEAEQRIASARAEAEKCVTEASEEAEEMRSEADAEAQSVRRAAKAEHDMLLRRVRLQCENSAVALEEAFSTAREYHSESLSRIDTAWKQLLRSLPDAEGDEETPPDLAAKINRIVRELEDLESV
jgi:cell division septum initiation protein DivIVA